jgi:hypothetical protein
VNDPLLFLNSILPRLQEFLEGGSLPEGFGVMHLRKNNRGMLLRVNMNNRLFLVKISELHGGLNNLRRIFGITTGRREFRIHRMMEKANVNVPRTFGFLGLKTKKKRQFDLMVIEDLGTITRGVDFVKQSLMREDFNSLHRLENTAIHMTHRMLEAGITDIDHQLNNIVIDVEQSVFRIDFECARHWRFGPISNIAIGQMLGRLIISHVFACQDIDLLRSKRFAQELVNILNVRSSALTFAKSLIESHLKAQRLKKGVCIKFELPW